MIKIKKLIWHKILKILFKLNFAWFYKWIDRSVCVRYHQHVLGFFLSIEDGDHYRTKFKHVFYWAYKKNINFFLPWNHWISWATWVEYFFTDPLQCVCFCVDKKKGFTIRPFGEKSIYISSQKIETWLSPSCT